MNQIPDLQNLLNSEDLNSSIIDIDNFISELCIDGDEIEKLSEPQKIFYLNQYLEREINNGGFDQYFSNSGSEFAYETVNSLKAIGADKTADILQRAIDLVEKLVKENKEIEIDVWDDLDEEFLNYEEDLNALNIEYIKKHKEFF